MAFQYKGFRASKPRAIILDAKKGTYQVFFIVYPALGPRQQIKFQKELNTQHTRKQRETEAWGAADACLEALKAGWNPLKETYPTFVKDLQVLQELTLSTALDRALLFKKPHLSKFSYYDYAGCVRFIKAAAGVCGLLDLPIKQIERKDIRLIMATAKEQRNWTANARNKYLTILKSLFTVMVDEIECIKFNCVHGIKNEPAGKTIGYRRLTQNEKDRICEHLIVVAPDYFEYLMPIYDLGTRRKETLLLKVSDINLSRREIIVRDEVAKTNAARIIPITDTIMEILLRREIYKLPSNWFIFSNDKFRPGPLPYHPNVPTQWWEKLVQKDLGIDCKMYALKHSGADAKILAGTPLQALQTMYGHKSSLMTEIYAKEIINQYRQQIIDKAPVFSGKVIQMKRAK